MPVLLRNSSIKITITQDLFEKTVYCFLNEIDIRPVSCNACR